MERDYLIDIANCLHGLAYDDLTAQEKGIYQILSNAGYMTTKGSAEFKTVVKT